MTFCPLIKGECREDCAWHCEEYEIDGDGVAHWDYCAVVSIGESINDLADRVQGGLEDD